jgi:hypothetical protein
MAAVVATLLFSAALAGTALAGGRGVAVRGTQLAAGSCENGGYAMIGDLDGCWWIDTFVPKGAEDKSHYRATGTEHFTGCIHEVCGTFFTTFSFTAKTDGPYLTSAEIHGRCHHPIVRGIDGFTGIGGELSFHDVLTDPPTYPYWGSVRLASRSITLSASRVVATTSSTTAASSC